MGRLRFLHRKNHNILCNISYNLLTIYTTEYIMQT
nr:MAG TPA: hypothetical protein [Caudoviricetes sp.]